MTSSQSSSVSGSQFVVYLIGLFAVLTAMFLIWLMPPAQQEQFLMENGPVELFSALGYLVCIALIVGLMGLRTALKYWYVCLLLIALTLRELDMDKAPFSAGLLKSKQYFDPMIPVFEKAMALAILIVLATAIIITVRNHFSAWLAGLLRLDGLAWCIFGSLGFAATTKLADGIGRKLGALNIHASTEFLSLAFIYEEVGEAGIPIMIALAILIASKRTHNKSSGTLS